MATYSLTQQISIVFEARRRGFPDSTIAEKLGLPADDPVFQINLSNEIPLGLKLSGVAEGFREWQFHGWPKAIKEVVIILLARVAEAAFRRGLQQGYLFAINSTKLKIHPDKMRWDGGYSLDDARMCCDGTPFTSKQRLSCEHGHALQMLGLLDADDLQIH